MARDQYAAATAAPRNLKLADSYRSTVRAQAVVAQALGEQTPKTSRSQELTNAMIEAARLRTQMQQRQRELLAAKAEQEL